MSDPLERAIEALRGEPIAHDVRARDDRTLARILASAERDRSSDALLDEAIAAVRDEPLESNGEATRERIHASLARETRDRRGLWAVAAAALVAMALVSPTAWAWARDGIARWIAESESVQPAPATETPTPPVRQAPAPVRAQPSTEPEVPAIDPTAPIAPALDARPRDPSAPPRAAQPSVERTPRRSVERAADHAPPPPVDRPAPADTETRAFQDAHRAHFDARDFTAALQAWDRYLDRHPRGRYLPEARYNRALALVHLGRLSEAREVLARFAAAEPGAYRQAEAASLVRALDARIAAQAER